MKGSLVIEYRDDCQRIDYEFEESYSQEKGYDYLLWITLPLGQEYDKSKIKIGLNKYLLRKLNGKGYRRDFPQRVELLEQAYSEGIDIFDNCDVKLSTNIEELLPMFQHDKDKKIIITDQVHPLTIEEVEKLEQQYQGYSNVYFKVEGNDDPISLPEYRITVEFIDEVVNRIKSYDFSPLEQIIYAYDYVRDRIYQREKPGESSRISRDLTKVLFGDAIVCVGYSRTFCALLNKLGIKAQEYVIRLDDEGHSIALAHIIDKKYNINGIYYFDPTRDRKRNDTNDHFYNYSSFAKTKDQLKDLGEFTDKTFGDENDDFYYELARMIQEGKPVRKACSEYKYLSNMSSFVEGKPIDIHTFTSAYTLDQMQQISHLADNISLCTTLMRQPLKPETLLQAFARVRRVEYYENPQKFPLSFDAVNLTAVISNWKEIESANDPVQETLLDRRNDYDVVAKGIDLVKVLQKVRNKTLSEDK